MKVNQNDFHIAFTSTEKEHFERDVNWWDVESWTIPIHTIRFTNVLQNSSLIPYICPLFDLVIEKFPTALTYTYVDEEMWQKRGVVPQMLQFVGNRSNVFTDETKTFRIEQGDNFLRQFNRSNNCVELIIVCH